MASTFKKSTRLSTAKDRRIKDIQAELLKLRRELQNVLPCFASIYLIQPDQPAQ
jgi:hypothetical protein